MQVNTNQKRSFIMSAAFSALLIDTSGTASWQQILVQILTQNWGQK